MVKKSVRNSMITYVIVAYQVSVQFCLQGINILTMSIALIYLA